MVVREVGPIGGSSLPVRAVRWAVALPLATLRYLIDRVPLRQRHDQHLSLEDVTPPDLGRDLPGEPETVQRADGGVGPLFHRTYAVLLADAQWGPEALIDRVLADPNGVAPSRLARFETFDGEFARDLQTGDEFVVRFPGPWNGPVRLVERTPTSFRLATLRGHMEAGEIEFAASHDDRGLLRFRIESWARSEGRLFNLLYRRLPIGREMQLHLWAQVCERVARASGGAKVGGVTATTQRLSAP